MAGTKYLGSNDDNKKSNPVKEGGRLYSKEDIIGFAEWALDNCWQYSKSHWHNGGFFKGWLNRTSGKYEYKTTEELFNLFLQTLNK